VPLNKLTDVNDERKTPIPPRIRTPKLTAVCFDCFSEGDVGGEYRNADGGAT